MGYNMVPALLQTQTEECTTH